MFNVLISARVKSETKKPLATVPLGYGMFLVLLHKIARVSSKQTEPFSQVLTNSLCYRGNHDMSDVMLLAPSHSFKPHLELVSGKIIYFEFAIHPLHCEQEGVSLATSKLWVKSHVSGIVQCQIVPQNRHTILSHHLKKKIIYGWCPLVLHSILVLQVRRDDRSLALQ